MLVKIILSALSLSTSLNIGFASEGTTSPDSKNKLSCIGERLFQDAWECSKGNYSYYQSFFEPFYKEILDTDVTKVREKRIRLMETSRRIYSAVASNQVESNTRIPHTTHRVWITNGESPHEIPTERLQTYFNNLGILEGNDWKHIFWCLDKTKIPQTVQAIENSGKNIVVRELSEIMPQFRGKGVYERLYNGKYYTAVSDVVRFNLLNIFGGIYSDFGAVFKADLTPLLDNFDYLFGQEGYLVGTSFVAAQAQSPVFNAVLEFIDNLDRVPVEYRSWGDHIVTPRWTALGILTLMMDHYTMESDRVLPIPYGEDSLVKTNHMGSWLGNTPQFGQVSLQKNPISEATFFGESTIFDKPYRMDEAADPMIRFTVELAQKLYGINEATLKEKEAQLLKTSKDVFYDLRAGKNHGNIPHITHRCWITNPQKPNEAPEDKLQMYVDSLKALTSNSDWRHIFWCMNPDQIPKTIQFLKDSGHNIEIHSLSEIMPQMRGRAIFEAMFKDNRYCNANDITRLNILYRYGGLYADLGFTFRRDFTPFVDAYDYIVFLYQWGGIDHGLCGTKPKDPVIDRHLTRLDTLHLLPDDIKALTPDAPSQLIWTGSHHFRALLDIFSPPDTKILFVPDNSLVKHERGQSWGKDAKFGNKPIAKSNVDIFTVAQGKIDSTLEKKIRIYCPNWASAYSNYTTLMNGSEWTYLGEFLRAEALKQLFNVTAPNAQIVTTPLALRKGDIFLIEAGNILHQWHSEWADSIRRELADVDPEASVVVTSASLHSANLEESLDIHPGTVAFLKDVLKRSHSIGVGGEHTKSILEKYGIKTTIVGTSSLLGLTPPATLLQTKDSAKTVAITAVFDSFNALTQHSLLNFGIQNDATYIALTEKEFLKWPSEQAETVLSRLPTFSNGNWEQQVLFHRYNETQEKEGWFAERFKELGLKEPYFNKFVDLIRRKIVSPKNLKDWLDIAAKHDLVISSRLEGVIAGLLAGTRSICLAHDSHTEEACKAMSIPYTKWIHPLTPLKELYDLADPTLFILNYEKYTNNYHKFLKENAVPVTQTTSTLVASLPRIIRERATPVKVFCERWQDEPYDDFSVYETAHYEWNIGENLFANAAKKLFPAYTIARSAKDLKKSDAYLLVVSNVINGYDSKWSQSVLKTIGKLDPEVSVVAICMGAQSPSLDEDTEVHPTTVSLLKEIAKRSKSIGVRGAYTQNQLERYGIPSRVVGCPSLLSNSLRIESLKQSKDEVTKVAVGATLYSTNPLPQHALLSFAVTQQATYIIQTERELLEWKKLDSAEAVVDRLEGLAKQQKLPYDQKKTINRYLESKPDHAVFTKLQSMGVSATYFKDFAEVVRTKAVFPKSLQDWINTLKEFDVVVSSRIHGIVAGLLAGTRGLCVAHDSRTLELCQTLKIPYVTDFNPLTTAKQAYDLADPTAFIANYESYKANYADFLIGNGLPTNLT